jgi:hypothetical protein
MYFYVRSRGEAYLPGRLQDLEDNRKRQLRQGSPRSQAREQSDLRVKGHQKD